MTAIIEIPGVLTPQPGTEPALIQNTDGFLVKGLEAAYLFEEGSGTAVADTEGGSAGVIETVNASNDATSWLSGGGGLSISGGKLISLASFEANSAWTIFTFGAITGDVGADSEKIVGLIGFRDWTGGSIRGPAMYVRGATDLDAPSTAAYYALRPPNGSGSVGTAVNLAPTNINVSAAKRMMALSYDGSATIRATVYDSAGAVIATNTAATNDAALFTISAVTVSTLTPSLGGWSTTYASGTTQLEAAVRYSRYLGDFTAGEIAVLAANGAAIGAARGRAW